MAAGGFGNEIERMLLERPASRQLAAVGTVASAVGTLDDLMAELGSRASVSSNEVPWGGHQDLHAPPVTCMGWASAVQYPERGRLARL